jgi:hypothetical protein
VASVWGRKFLGYCFWAAPKGEVRAAVAKEALHRYKQRIRQIPRRRTGRKPSGDCAGTAELSARLEG